MPVEITELRSRDASVVHDTLNRMYAFERPLQFLSTSRPFELLMRSAQVGDLQTGRFRLDLPTRTVMPPLREFVAALVVSGRISWSAGSEQLTLSRGDVVRFPRGNAIDTAFTDHEVVLVQIPFGTVERVARTHTGIAGGEVRFEGLAPLPSAARSWRELAGYVHRSLTSADVSGYDPLATPIVVAQLVDLVAGTALAVFPNTTMTLQYVPGVGRVSPAALRRAVAYIDAHSREPITLADIADAAGTTGRAVQAAFQRHYGLTPTGYLRRVRLDGAHHDLKAADPTAGATVAAVAARWGFADNKRFTTYYRDQYGVLPSQTLRD
jgi:AraC-like DNA-binding protein